MASSKITFTEDVQLPRGFKAAGAVVGLKKSGKPDMAMIASEPAAVMAGTFTTNQVKAATVRLCMKRLARNGRAIVINSGNANACNGPQGLIDAERMAALTAELIGSDERDVFVCSTGRIGVRLPMDIIEPGIRKTAAALSREGGKNASEAIMTTDTKPKRCSARFTIDRKPVTLTAMAKGSGMIEPNMATMLAFFLTDAAVDRGALQDAVSAAVNKSFNRITVDGDRSTNDTVLFMANGAAENKTLKPSHPDWAVFEEAIQMVAMHLALLMVQDGEGASRVVTVRVTGARSEKDADIAARSVANSLLVKTSWAGDYPNWGRIMDALGYSDAKIAEDRVEIRYDDLVACRDGVYAGTPIEKLKRVVTQKAFTIEINLNIGSGEAVIYTCNCTEEYVRINM